MDLPPEKEIIKTYQSIVDITLCAICLDTVSKEMVQCINGHLLCAKCKGNIKKCPTCEGVFSWQPPSRFIIQLLEALPPKCRYKDCGKFISRSPDDEDHEKNCGFRPTTCKLEDCQWTGPGKNIVRHLEEVHPSQNVYTCCRKVVMKSFDISKNQTQYDSFLLRNHFMWQEMTYDVEKKALINYFHFVPLTGHSGNNIYMQLEASAKEMNCKFHIKLNADPDVPKEEAPFISIPQFMLSHFVDEEKNLTFHVLLTGPPPAAGDRPK